MGSRGSDCHRRGFSPNAIAYARKLARDLGLNARFVESDVYKLSEALTDAFDIVFASYGVLCWLPDLPAWARVVARFVKPGGVFYLVDDHPVSAILNDDGMSISSRYGHGYFTGGEALTYESPGTYATSEALANNCTVQFQHTLGEVVTSICEAGLRIEFLHEFPFAAWQGVPVLQKRDDGYWHLPDESRSLLPLLFSLKGRKTE